MAITLAFDVYGTLIDTAGVVTALRQYAGDRAPAFSGLWREKQLEYSFRRALMQNYCSFDICTSQALDYCCQAMAITIPPAGREALLTGYRQLPPFEDARLALLTLGTRGFRLFAFSNGHPDDLKALLDHSGIAGHFNDIVSTHEIMSFKPNPAVYAHFLRRAEATGHEAWMISGNPFDAIGAISAGMKAAWVKRSATALYDPWGIAPSATVGSLGELADAIAGSSAAG